MNVFERLKNLFQPKKEEKQEENTTISLYDVNDVVLPNYNELPEQDQSQILAYKQRIDINKLEEMIKYNQDIAKDGEFLSNLLIKYLYELNEVTRKDNKSDRELQEIRFNTAINNIKVLTIKNMLEELLKNSYLRTIALEKYREDNIKREHKFVEIFSRAARIKRNMELKSLDEAINRSKITIKTITYQINAVNNALNNSDILTNKIEIYNKLKFNIQAHIIRDVIYDKLDFIIKVNRYLNLNFEKLNEIIKILKEKKILENKEKLIELIAISEIELDKYRLNNKDKIVSEYINKIKELKNTEITHNNENNILVEIKKLQVIRQIFKEYIDESFKEDIYKLKFDLLTYDINEKNELYTNFYHSNREDVELKHYYDIIMKKISDINQGISPVAKKLNELNKLKKMINLLNPYFKSFDGKYRYNDILIDRNLLALLLAFDSLDKFDLFFKQYRLSTTGTVISDTVFLPLNNFEWEDYIPLETVYLLYETNGRLEEPIYYEIYKLYYGKIVNYKNNLYIPLQEYKLPEGIRKIKGSSTRKTDNTVDKLFYYIKEQADGGLVEFPSSLKKIGGNIFSDILVKDLKLNEELVSIGDNVFQNQEFSKISFPKNLEKIGFNTFNFYKISEIEFQDFKQSKLLYNLIYSNEEWARHLMRFLIDVVEYSIVYYQPILNKIFLLDGDDTYEINNRQLINFVKSFDNSIIDWNEISINFAKLIEEATGFNIKKNNEQNKK